MQQSILISIFKKLFIAVILLLPFFGSFPYTFGFFHHFTSSASAYPAIPLALLCMFVLFSSSIRWNALDVWFHAFLAWTFITYFIADIGSPSLETSDYLTLVIIFVLYNSAKYLSSKGYLHNSELRRFLRFSSIPLLGYLTIELGAYAAKIGLFSSLLGFVEPLVHSFSQGDESVYRMVVHSKRVRGLAMEPSFYSCIFSLYFAFYVSQWVDRRHHQSRFIYGALAILVLSVLYSGSESVTSAFIVICSGLVFVYFRRSYGFAVCAALTAVSFVMLMVASDLYWDAVRSHFTLTQTSYSLSSRYYSALGSILAALDNPILGYGAEFSKKMLLAKLPAGAFDVAVAEYWYLNNLESDAVFFALLVRVLAQNGFVGFLLFVGMWTCAILRCYRAVIASSGGHMPVPSYAMFLLLATLSSFAMTAFVGVFLVYPYWIVLGLASALHDKCSWNDRA